MLEVNEVNLDSPPPRNAAVIVALITPQGFPLVRDTHRYGIEANWKFTGGEVKPGEVIRIGGCRELEEESGIIVPPDTLKLYREPIIKRNYDIYPLVGKIEQLPTDGTLKRYGDEFEETDIATALDIRRMADDIAFERSLTGRADRPFLYMHYEIYADILREMCSDEELRKWT